MKTERKIDFFYFSVNAISFGFVSVFVFVPFQDILDTRAAASSPLLLSLLLLLLGLPLCICYFCCIPIGIVWLW